MKNSKKIMLAAAVLAFAGMTSVNAEQVKFKENSSIVLNIQDRTPIEEAALPDAVKAALVGDAYSGWSVKEAFSVQSADSIPFYAITLQKDDETQTVNLNEAGQIVESPASEPIPSQEPTLNEEPTPMESQPSQPIPTDSEPADSESSSIPTE